MNMTMHRLLCTILFSCLVSSQNYPLPTSLTKRCTQILLPLITASINVSLGSGVMPVSLKRAIVTPLIKKSDASPQDLSNYRPISNLCFLGKVIEKAAVTQIQEYLSDNNLHSPLQSAFRQLHSVETALVRVQNDILLALDQRKEVLLVLLDFSSAFDTIDHAILLDRLNHRFGLDGVVLKWLTSYLSERSQVVKVGEALSSPVVNRCGVPQGSVVGPLLYTLYSAPIADIISAHGLCTMLYADDTQIYVTYSGNDQQTAILKVNNCLKDIVSWAYINKLKINADKTELVHFSSKFNPSLYPASIEVNSLSVLETATARNLGVFMDLHLQLKDHLKITCRSAMAAIRKIGQIRNFLDKKTTEKLIHAFVSSRIDCCNALLFG